MVSIVRLISGYKQSFPIPETQSAFHPRAQRSAFHRRDARQQQRLFARLELIAETQPQLHPAFAEIVSDDFPVLHHLELCSRHCLLFNTSPNDSEQHDGNDSNPSQEGFMESKLT